MPSLNKVELIGHLGGDPKTQTFQSGDMQASFSLATSEDWTDKRTGEPVSKVQWQNIVIKNQPLAKVAQEFLKKGSFVRIEGQMEYRDFTDRDGNKHRASEVVLNPFRGELLMLDKKPSPG
jgi:single-strand DNA-binding protein